MNRCPASSRRQVNEQSELLRPRNFNLNGYHDGIARVRHDNGLIRYGNSKTPRRRAPNSHSDVLLESPNVRLAAPVKASIEDVADEAEVAEAVATVLCGLELGKDASALPPTPPLVLPALAGCVVVPRLAPWLYTTTPSEARLTTSPLIVAATPSTDMVTLPITSFSPAVATYVVEPSTNDAFCARFALLGSPEVDFAAKENVVSTSVAMPL